MSDPFIAEVKIFAGNYAPRNWAFCDGQVVPISQYTALFALLGPTYGGDGRITFGLPNLRDRVPMHPGQGPGLTPRFWGQWGGSETVTLTEAQMPAHKHALVADGEDGESSNPAGQAVGAGNDMFTPTWAPVSNRVDMAPQSLETAGGNQPHQNLQPVIVLNYIIALQGIFPPRN